MSQSQQTKVLRYDQIRIEAEKPSGERKMVRGKDGSLRSVRKYSKTDKELSIYWTKRRTLGSFINPLERDGPCKGQVSALMVLGLDKWHSFAGIKGVLPGVMEKMPSTVHANQWVAFVSKPMRNVSKGKDIDGRIIQNFEVLQRLTGKDPYGYKLMQAHSCIDIKFVPTGQDPDRFDSGAIKNVKGTFYFRLNTSFTDVHEVSPYNNYKGKRRGRPRKKPS